MCSMVILSIFEIGNCCFQHCWKKKEKKEWKSLFETQGRKKERLGGEKGGMKERKDGNFPLQIYLTLHTYTIEAGYFITPSLSPEFRIKWTEFSRSVIILDFAAGAHCIWEILKRFHEFIHLKTEFVTPTVNQLHVPNFPNRNYVTCPKRLLLSSLFSPFSPPFVIISGVKQKSCSCFISFFSDRVHFFFACVFLHLTCLQPASQPAMAMP